MAEQIALCYRQDFPGRVPGGWVAGWVRKAENKAKDHHSTDIFPSELIAELQHFAWLGKTFPGGWMGGEKLGKRLISASWS